MVKLEDWKMKTIMSWVIRVIFSRKAPKNVLDIEKKVIKLNESFLYWNQIKRKYKEFKIWKNEQQVEEKYNKFVDLSQNEVQVNVSYALCISCNHWVDNIMS